MRAPLALLLSLVASAVLAGDFVVVDSTGA